MNSACLYYRMGLDHTKNPETYRAAGHKLVLMSVEAPRFVPGLRHYLFFFRGGATEPEYSYNYEVSDAGSFLASWQADMHLNYGPTKQDMTFEEFKKKAFDWVATKEGFRLAEIVGEAKSARAGGFLRRLFG